MSDSVRPHTYTIDKESPNVIISLHPEELVSQRGYYLFQLNQALKTDESTLTHHITQSLELALRFSLGVVHSVGLDKCITR